MIKIFLAYLVFHLCVFGSYEWYKHSTKKTKINFSIFAAKTVVAGLISTLLLLLFVALF